MEIGGYGTAAQNRTVAGAGYALVDKATQEPFIVSGIYAQAGLRLPLHGAQRTQRNLEQGHIAGIVVNAKNHGAVLHASVLFWLFLRAAGQTAMPHIVYKIFYKKNEQKAQVPL